MIQIQALFFAYKVHKHCSTLKRMPELPAFLVVPWHGAHDRLASLIDHDQSLASESQLCKDSGTWGSKVVENVVHVSKELYYTSAVAAMLLAGLVKQLLSWPFEQ